MSMNKVIIIGNLGGDPEMRYMQSGDAVTNFSVATNRRYKTQAGEEREEVEWFNVSAWGRLAEVTNEYLSKGRQVYVEGRLSTREYQRSDGEKGFSLDVRALEVQFLGGGGGEGAGPAADGAGSDMDDSDVDDLPW